MPTRRSFLAFSAAAALAGCTGLGTSGISSVRVSERQAMEIINALRARNGVGPVRLSSALQTIAGQQSRAMAGADRLAHEINPGLDLNGRIRRAGYHGIAGENISAGQDTLAEVIDGWMASSGHRHNLLEPRFTEFGIAAARTSPERASRYGIYWTIVLGAQPGAAPRRGTA